MTKILFVQRDSFPAFGIMWISAVLKKHGYKTDVLLWDQHKDVIREIEKQKPFLVGVPVVTGEHRWAIRLCRELRSRNIPTILGYSHPTFYPEIILEDGVNMICRGEGEFPLLESVRRMEDGLRIDNICNIWVKENGKVRQNNMRPFINLDDLPLPDREVYYSRYGFLRDVSVKQFLTGRGCPFSCSFCSNHLLRRLGRGKYVRRRNVDQCINEILIVKEKYPLETVSFTDDTFGIDRKWLRRFLDRYKHEVDLPFICNFHVQLINEDLVRMLAENCCYGISFGIESGSEALRAEVLHKYFSNQQVLDAGRLCHKHGLKIKTYNMIGIPGETIQDAFKTVKINTQIKPEQTSVSFLQPYPKYTVANYAIDRGLLPKNFGVENIPPSIYEPNPAIQLEDESQLINLQTFFSLAVRYPKLQPVVRELIKIPPNVFYRLLAKLFYGYYMARVHRMTVKDMMRYALHMNPFKV